MEKQLTFRTRCNADQMEVSIHSITIDELNELSKRFRIKIQEHDSAFYLQLNTDYLKIYWYVNKWRQLSKLT